LSQKTPIFSVWNILFDIVVAAITVVLLLFRPEKEGITFCLVVGIGGNILLFHPDIIEKLLGGGD
jgi:hypothetical protein